MAYFCPVAPLPVLEGLLQNSAIGRQHLLLAHDIVKEPNRKRYGEIFSKYLGSTWEAAPSLGELAKARIIILDNSVIELGNSVNLDVIMDAASIVQPTCAVLPDVMLDPIATIHSCMDAIDPWWAAFQKTRAPGSQRASLMYVPQGKTLADFVMCAEAMRGDGRIGFWGIPRNLVKYHGSREKAIRICSALNPSRKIHMLGFSDDNTDDLLCAKMPEVISIDSAVPLRYPGFYSISVNAGPRGDWWDKAEFTQASLRNLQIARKLFQGEKSRERIPY